MALDYSLEQTNENYLFTLASSSWAVVGAIQNDLGFSGGNDFSSAKEVLQNIPIVGSALKAKDSFGDIFKLSGRSNITDFESRLVWDASRKPQFNVEYKFYNLSAQQSVTPKGALSKAKQIHEAALPTKGKPAIGRKGRFFSAPLGYRFADTDVKGVLTLQVGKWFRATNLVLIDSQFTPSKQVLSNGQPVFVTGSFTVEPYQLITYEEFLEYFR